jgi:MFS family permease
VVLFLMPLAASIAMLAVLAVGLGAATATVSSMVFGLLATELPPERRSAALNLVYLPLYAAGTLCPAVGAVVASGRVIKCVGLVAGTAALVGALVSPLGGVIGDRIGFRPVLVAALSGAGVVLFLMPLAASVGMLAVLAVGLGAATATVSSMVFGLLATELPPERRSAALNLVYLPLYAAGTIGPAVGAVVASVSGIHGLFVVGGCVFLFGALTIVLRRGQAGDRQPRTGESLETGRPTL